MQWQRLTSRATSTGSWAGGGRALPVGIRHPEHLARFTQSHCVTGTRASDCMLSVDCVVITSLNNVNQFEARCTKWSLQILHAARATRGALCLQLEHLAAPSDPCWDSPTMPRWL